MYSIILAGGYGQRLMPISEFIPKALLPIRGKPLIDFIIEKLIKIEDLKKIYITTNKKFESNFNYYLKCLKKENVKLIVERSESNKEKLGSIGGLINVIKKEKLNNDLLVICGDNIFSFDLKKFVEFSKKINKVCICVYKTTDKSILKNFGNVIVKENKVKYFIEKPDSPKSYFISTGIYFFPKDSLKTILGYDGNKDSMGFLIKYLCERSEVYCYLAKGKWFDIGTIEFYRKAYYNF